MYVPIGCYCCCKCHMQVNLSSTTRLETMVQVDELAARLRTQGRGSFTASTPSTTAAAGDTDTAATAAVTGSTGAAAAGGGAQEAGAGHDSDASAVAESVASALQAAADPVYKVNSID
jgi:hypothetical protein